MLNQSGGALQLRCKVYGFAVRDAPQAVAPYGATAEAAPRKAGGGCRAPRARGAARKVGRPTKGATSCDVTQGVVSQGGAGRYAQYAS